MCDKAKKLPCINVDGGNFEAVSLDDFIEQMRKLQLDGWQICHIKAYVGVKSYENAIDNQAAIVSQQ